ncbi:hypothetical protein SK128_027463 [Halocaridina rubra]|uniref:Uncharacterized protein n=1 Tax=Halocaridina rubra TaxID=373956 RepID=A0AAN8WVK6_HALRR
MLDNSINDIRLWCNASPHTIIFNSTLTTDASLNIKESSLQTQTMYLSPTPTIKRIVTWQTLPSNKQQAHIPMNHFSHVSHLHTHFDNRHIIRRKSQLLTDPDYAPFTNQQAKHHQQFQALICLWP